MESFPGWEKAERIEGWFLKNEAELLNSLCTGLWCEIGCYKGRSTTILAETGYDGYAIDTWEGTDLPRDPTQGKKKVYETFLRNLDEYENVIIVRQDFREVPETLVPPELHLLHLDADHSYEMTKLAFEMFSPKVIPGGHVAFHDAKGGGWPGVEKFISELDGNHWRFVDVVGMLAAYKRL